MKTGQLVHRKDCHCFLREGLWLLFLICGFEAQSKDFNMPNYGTSVDDNVDSVCGFLNNINGVMIKSV